MLVRTFEIKSKDGNGYEFRGPDYTDYDGRKVRPYLLHRVAIPNDAWRVADFDLEATMQDVLADPDLVQRSSDFKNEHWYMKMYDGFVFVLYVSRLGKRRMIKRYTTFMSMEMDVETYAKDFQADKYDEEDETGEGEENNVTTIYLHEERLWAFCTEHGLLVPSTTE